MAKYFLEYHRDTAFYADGSLRDIYVQNTGIQDWQVLLNFLPTSKYKFQFLVGGEQQPLPNQVEDIFHQLQPVLLCIDQEHLALNSHFFAREEIDFDLNPSRINTDQQLTRLIDFIYDLGQLLQKEVILTPENMSEYPLFRFDPMTGREEWL